MTPDQCVVWVVEQCQPPRADEGLERREVSLRLNRVLSSWRNLESGLVFGLSIPEPIRDEVIHRARPAMEQALENWEHWIIECFGPEGKRFFQEAAEEAGLRQQTAVRPPA